MADFPALSSRMSMRDIAARFEQLSGLQVESTPARTDVTPHWGMFETATALPPETLARIRAAVYLEDHGDIARPEKTIIRLPSASGTIINGRCIRAVKLKGISSRLRTIKAGAARHIRLLGRGDIPLLVPYLSRAGTVEEIPFEVGEPYGAKRFRSVITEVAITRYAASRGCAVLAPIACGFYTDSDLQFKGEPAAFSIWGVPHSEDERFDAEWRTQFLHARERPETLEASLRWTRGRLERLLAQARGYHAAGLVHHEPQFDNHACAEDVLIVMDWEEAAHCSQLTRAQFMESVLIDLYKLICYCCAYEQEYATRMTQPPHPWFEYYFEGLQGSEAAGLRSLLPLRLSEPRKRGPFREAVLPLIEQRCRHLRFGPGVDWAEVARPFEHGYGSDAPLWRPHASTTFDPKLHVRKGARGLPGGDKLTHPSTGIQAAEQCLYDGRFGDACEHYGHLLACEPDRGPRQHYLLHNLASLCLALHRDEEARGYFERAYPLPGSL